jgi:hypothetical protein
MLGYGINSYFDMIYALMQLFLIISIVVAPIMFIYSNSESSGMEEYLSGPKLSIGQLTMGNMGGATVLCKSKRIEAGSIFNLNCPNA